jgi:hypothetical protein
VVQERTAAVLITKLKLEDQAKVEQGMDDVQKKTRSAGIEAEKTSKRWGLAFKAAGVFATGLFASILKGGPITSAFIGQLWQSIGNLGDTILQKAGAWTLLREITFGINNLNKAVRESDLVGYISSIQDLAGTIGAIRLFPAIGPILDTALKAAEEHGLWPAITAKYEEVKAFGMKTFTELKTFATNTWDRIKHIIGSSMDVAATLAQTAMDRIRKKWLAIKAAIEASPIIQRITTITSSISEAVGSLRRRQSGGPVTRGEPFMVGERGPEVFTPGATGRITPNGSSGGTGGLNIGTVQVTVQGSAFGDMRELTDRIGREFHDRMRGLGMG